MYSFAKSFKEILEKNTISKAELSRRLGLKRQNYITNIIAGRNIPSVARIKEVAKILNLSTEEKERLLTLAEKEKNDIKTSKKSYTFGPVWKVDTAKDIFHPSTGHRIALMTKEDFYNSNCFRMDEKSLEPHVNKGELFFAVEYSFDKKNVNVSEGALIALECKSDNSHPPLQLFGKLTKKTKESWTISNKNYKNENNIVSVKNIVRIAIILGKFFYTPRWEIPK